MGSAEMSSVGAAGSAVLPPVTQRAPSALISMTSAFTGKAISAAQDKPVTSAKRARIIAPSVRPPCAYYMTGE